MKAQIIEKEGKFYKECGVVILESNNPSHVYLVSKTNKLGYVSGKYKEDLEQFPQTIIETQNQHLYITSDDEIKEGDWYYDSFLKEISRANDTFAHKCGEQLFTYDNKYVRKIIATTDTSLTIQLENQCDGCKAGLPLTGNIHKDSQTFGIACSKGKYVDDLPQPSDKFIQAYIEAYNKSEKIEKVLVEWGNGCHCCEGSIDTCKQIQIKGHSLKVDCDTFRQPKLKDNNIIIKKTKDSWNREEVHSLMMQAWIHGEADKSMDYTVREKWIEENL